MIPIKELVKDNYVYFDFYRKGLLYYRLVRTDTSEVFLFVVPIADCGDATFPNKGKAITFMRYIRKSQEDGEFVKVAS